MPQINSKLLSLKSMLTGRGRGIWMYLAPCLLNTSLPEKSSYFRRCMCSKVYRDGENYFEHKVECVKKRKDAGEEVYPSKFTSSLKAAKFKMMYEHLQVGESLNDKVSLAGRVLTLRDSSKKLRFYDILDDGSKLQVIANKKHYEDEENFSQVCDNIHRGDIIGIHGIPMRSKSGELSVCAKQLRVLAPCLRMLPSTWDGLRGRETRFRKRYLDFIYNESSKNVFIQRAKIITFLRKFLESLNFVEVETPILSSYAGGANAVPFTTRHHSMEMDMFLRVAPELYLKMLVIGGMDRVFEIGRQFRNEGISRVHNPEFTSCEFYMAYSDYYDLMDLTETLLAKMVHELFESHVLKQGDKREIDFGSPFKRIKFMDSLESELGVTLPSPEVLHTEDSRHFLLHLCQHYGIKASSASPSAKLLDKLSSYFVESKCIQPTFIMDHPQVMSPLAKTHREKPGLTERFELYIAKQEVCNAYSELNDPQEQRERFRQQASEESVEEEEAHFFDDNFCVALEHGLPPTAGWGLGIDRLVMILTNSPHIKDVILFPTLKPKTQ